MRDKAIECIIFRGRRWTCKTYNALMFCSTALKIELDKEPDNEYAKKLQGQIAWYFDIVQLESKTAEQLYHEFLDLGGELPDPFL